MVFPVAEFAASDKLVGGDFKFDGYYESIHWSGEPVLLPVKMAMGHLSQHCSRKVLDFGSGSAS